MEVEHRELKEMLRKEAILRHGGAHEIADQTVPHLLGLLGNPTVGHASSKFVLGVNDAAVWNNGPGRLEYAGLNIFAGTELNGALSEWVLKLMDYMSDKELAKHSLLIFLVLGMYHARHDEGRRAGLVHRNVRYELFGDVVRPTW